MNILNIFSTKNKNESKELKYSSNLEKELDQNNIPFDIDDTGEEIIIDYINPYDKLIYEFKDVNNTLYLNGKEISLEDAFAMIKKQWEIDEVLIHYMEDDRFSQIFEIESFFKDITSENGLIGKLFPKKGNKEISLLYNIGKEPTKTDYLVGVTLSLTPEGIKYEILPDKIQTSPTGAAIHILDKIYSEVPLFFTSGNYKVKEHTPFTDVIKTYLINLALINRLNDIEDVEAQITDPENANVIFVIFKNGSAIEYMSPTVQNPAGRFLIIDSDEDNTVEDNESYSIVGKILKLPSLLNNKPNEENMPKRNFSRNRRIT